MEDIAMSEQSTVFFVISCGKLEFPMMEKETAQDRTISGAQMSSPGQRIFIRYFFHNSQAAERIGAPLSPDGRSAKFLDK